MERWQDLRAVGQGAFALTWLVAGCMTVQGEQALEPLDGPDAMARVRIGASPRTERTLHVARAPDALWRLLPGTDASVPERDFVAAPRREQDPEEPALPPAAEEPGEGTGGPLDLAELGQRVLMGRPPATTPCTASHKGVCVEVWAAPVPAGFAGLLCSKAAAEAACEVTWVEIQGERFLGTIPTGWTPSRGSERLLFKVAIDVPPAKMRAYAKCRLATMPVQFYGLEFTTHQHVGAILSLVGLYPWGAAGAAGSAVLFGLQGWSGTMHNPSAPALAWILSMCPLP